MNYKPEEYKYFDEEVYEYILSAIVQNINIERMRQGISMKELAIKARINESYVSAMLSGNKKMGLKSLIAICFALECDIGDVYPLDFVTRKTYSDRISDIMKPLDIAAKNYLMAQCVEFVKEYRRLTK